MGQGDALTHINGIVIHNTGFKRLVDAVLAPGLGQRLELDIGRVAADAAIVTLNSLHLAQVERGPPLAREV